MFGRITALEAECCKCFCGGEQVPNSPKNENELLGNRARAKCDARTNLAVVTDAYITWHPKFNRIWTKVIPIVGVCHSYICIILHARFCRIRVFPRIDCLSVRNTGIAERPVHFSGNEGATAMISGNPSHLISADRRTGSWRKRVKTCP